MEVVGSDGRHVGRVDPVKATEIEPAKFDFGAGLRDHIVRLTWVESMEGEKLRLSVSVDEAKAAWTLKH